MRDSYNKRLNLLIHGLDKPNKAWETRVEAKEILFHFVKEGLKTDPLSLTFVDFHQLPQAPIFKRNKPVTQPVIIKLATVFDKKTILNNAKKLEKLQQIEQFD